ncbi:S-layer homology domain-containing protein [Hominicoprocola fusiformis]
MKKFLSSLLALTMILSLVIVPAQATGDTLSEASEAGFSVSVKGSKSSAVVDDVVTFVANIPSTITVTDGDASEKSYTGTVTAFSWSVGSAYTAGKTTNAREFTATAKTATASGDTIKATCEFTVSYEKTSGSTTTIQVSKTASLPVVSKQDAFATAVKGATVTYQGRNYTISNDMKVTIDKFASDPDFSAENVRLGTVSGYSGAKIVKDTSGSWFVKNSDETLSVALTVTPQSVNPSVTLALDDYATANGVRKGQTVTVTATYTGGINANTATYKWTVSDQTSEFTANGKTLTFVPKNTGSYTVTCKVSEGLSTDVAQKTTDAITVNPDSYDVVKDNFSTSMAPGEVKPFSVKTTGATTGANDYSVKWTSSNTSVADFTTLTKNEKIGMLKANNKSGSTTVTAKVTFKNKVYTVSGDVSVSAADATLDKITNGSSDYLSDSSLKDIVAQAIKKSTGSTVSTSKINTIKVATGGFPSHVTLYEDEVKSANKITSTTKDLTNVDYLYFDTDAGYIGTAELNLDVTLTGESGTIAVALYIPVVGDETIKDTVTGTSANKEVSFTNDDYTYLYYSYSKPTYEGYFNGSKVDGFEYPVKENKTVTVPASKFNSSKTVTLYVVGVDSKGVASTGTITVSQKSYDINYNVVAGKSVTFNQKDFESFLEDIADDAGVYNSRKDTLELSYVKFSLPNSTREGVLYEGKSKIDRNDKVEDLDKVTFESVAKAKDTITISFTAYGKLYKDGASKGKDVDYSGNVVISVVKEDITYTVGIDDTVQLTARDFVNFLQDARTSYRKAELDYVKFDVSGKNVSSYAYGGLYRSYSSYSTGKLADSTDKFYYEPSRTQYDLADVAYHTTRWAEAGKTVYIPFTVYGTKNEEASGTMAITIAQTMNFIDVKASDFFYEPVKWAVNNKITNGTSSTTFSPYKNCNRAEIVTFLWRAAGSPEPTSTRNPFTDVNSVRDASYYKAILWASQKGITAGTNATTFSPYQECTRSQIVTFLYRYAGKPSGYYSNPFKDVSSVNEASYYNAILWAVGKGITQGTSTTTFSPYASCTRGEAVTFLYRYVNGVK